MTATVAFVQSVAIYPMFLFLALYFQDVLGLTPFETGLRLLPVTVALFAVAPIAGSLTGRVPAPHAPCHRARADRRRACF